LLAQAARAMGRCIDLRRDAGDGSENPVKMKAAHSSGIGQLIETGRLFRRFDQPAGLLHGRGAPQLERRLIGTAASAGTESGALGILAARVEAHILAPWQARAARGSAVDSGGRDRIEERAVRAPVSARHGFPAVGIAREGWQSCENPCFHSVHHSAPVGCGAQLRR